MKKLALLLMLLGSLTFPAAGQTVTNSLVKGPAAPTVTWERCPDSMVSGYYVKYGDLAQAATHVVEVGNTNAFTLTGLTPNVTNFIYVTSHDASGAESDPSSVLLYCPISEAAPAAAPTISPTADITTTPPAPLPSVAVVPAASPVTLSVRQAAVAVQFPVAAGIRYYVQASKDLKAWTTVGVAESEVSGVSEYLDPDAVQPGQRFYRVLEENRQALALR